MPKYTRKKDPISHRIRHAAKQAAVPHAHNDYRPHLIRWPSLVVAVFGVIILQMSYNLTQNGSVLGQATDITSRELLAKTNQVRAEYGEPTLRTSSQLSQAAALKADDMFAGQYWAHTSPTGVSPWQWFQQAGYDYHDAGENLAKGFHSGGGVMEAWMNSAEHRDNILDVNYSEVGFAVKSGTLEGKPTTLVVAMYGAPKTVAVAGVAVNQTAAPINEKTSLITRFGIGLQSMTPAAVGSLVLLAGLIVIALAAQSYRKQLPNQWRRTWKQHHGLYKALGMTSLAVIVITLYSGGQI